MPRYKVGNAVRNLRTGMRGTIARYPFVPRDTVDVWPEGKVYVRIQDGNDVSYRYWSYKHCTFGERAKEMKLAAKKSLKKTK